MDLLGAIASRLKNTVIQNLTEAEVVMIAKKKLEDFASTGIEPTHVPERVVSLEQWRNAVDLATNHLTRSRWQLYRVYDNAMNDLHLYSVIDDLRLKAQSIKYKFIDPKGKEDMGAQELIQSLWYLEFVKHAIDTPFYGFSLIEMFNLSDMPETVKFNSGNKTFKPLKEITLIPRAHVRPEEGKWLVNTFDPIGQGNDYLQYPSAHYYLPIGKKDDIGLLKKLSPMVLAKRYAMGAWSEYDDKLGIPFRTVTMRGVDKKREQLLANIMTKMGSAGWAILHEGEKIELLANMGMDVHKCFKELIELVDKQISKFVLGGTMTKDAEGGQYKGEMHMETEELRFQANSLFIKLLMKTELFPRLIHMGYPLQGYTVDIDDTKKLSVEELVKLYTMLLQHYKVSEKFIAEQFDIPLDMIEGKSAEDIQDILTETQKKKGKIAPAKKNESEAVRAKVLQLYQPAYGNHHFADSVKMVGKDGFKDIEAILQKIYNGELSADNLDKDYVEFTFEQLRNAFQDGFGANFDLKEGDADYDFMQNIKENIQVFSGMKTYQSLRDFTNLLLDGDGNLKTFSQFKSDAKAIAKDYDVHFLAAEYQLAVGSGQMAEKWKSFAKEPKYNLEYSTAGDMNVRPAHQLLDKIIRPANDPFWSTHWPPNGWGCRCTVRQTLDSPTDGEAPSIDMPEMFRNNVGKSGVLFPESHPYFEMNKEVRKSVQNRVKEFFSQSE